MKKLILGIATLALIGIVWRTTTNPDPTITITEQDQPTNDLGKLTGELEQMEAELNQLLSFTGGN